LGGYLLQVRKVPVRLWESFTQPTSEPSTPGAVPPPPPTPLAETPETPSELPALPPLADSDTVVRDLARGLSSRPELAEWLATPELVRKVVAAVENVAGGESPRPHLLFLAPATRFDVIRREGRLYVDPQSYARYDRIADVIASLDPKGTAELGRRLQPLLDEAYGE